MCSPRSGGARPDRARRGVETRAGCRPGGGHRTPGARPRRTCPSARASGESNAVTTSAIGAERDLGRVERRGPVRRSVGQRAARRGSAAARRDARPGRRSWRSAGRRPAPAAPSAAQKRGHWRSDPTATASSPSAVAKVSYGTMFGWALPRRSAARPVTKAFWAWLTSTASVEPSRETSTRWPASTAARASAARIPIAANRPVTTSLIATPTLVGRPPSASASPVIDISPPTAWITKS